LYGRGIRVTHDGGMTWSNPHLGRHVDPADGPVDGEVLAFNVRGDSVWALIPCVDGSGCVDLYVSADGGVAWQRRSTPRIRSTTTYIDLVRVTDSAAFAVAAAGLEAGTPDFADYHHVATTWDEGRTWEYRPDPCQLTILERLAGDSAGHLWLICGGQGATAEEGKEVFRSDDAAKHWRRTAAILTDHNVGHIPSGGGLERLIAVSASRAYLGLGRYTQIQTTDGGRTWRPSFPDPSGEGGRPLNFVDQTHGWAVGDHAFYRTTDGLQWVPLGASR
jgi:photosystem II stability/assembly factor-like uncharacterized protein